LLGFSVLALTLAASGSASAQSSGGFATRSGASAASSTAGSLEEIRSIVYLSGQVLLEDGTPPSPRAAIERVCNGAARPEGFTDSRGLFSIQLGRNQNVNADATVASEQQGSVFDRGSGHRTESVRLTDRELANCDLRASLSGYIPDMVPLAGRRLLDNPDVGLLVLRRPVKIEGTTVSATNASAPRAARRALDKAQRRLKDGQPASALSELEKAVQVYPKYASAWTFLGRVRFLLGDPAGARAAYARAMEADPKYVPPLLDLSSMAFGQSRWSELAELTQQTLKLAPVGFPRIYFYRAAATLKLYDLEGCERSARETIRLDTQQSFPKAHHILGVLLAVKGDYGESAEHLKTYLHLSPDAGDAEVVKRQLARVRTMAGPAGRPGVSVGQ
jgi:tetratricopeptide (TPR) repeat protein